MYATVSGGGATARKWTTVVCLLAITFGWLVGARAEVIIEVYVGQRPADADKVLAPLREILAQHGVSARPSDIIHRYRDRLPMPGSGLDPDVTAKRISDTLKLGFTAFSKGRFQDAIDKLEQGLAWARQNPALLLGFDNATDVFTKSYAALGMSYLKRNASPTDDDKKHAHEAWAEQIRYFPAVPMPRDIFGPEGDDLANATRKELAPIGTGRLIVVVNRGDAQIYVGPTGAGRGGVFTASVVPGDYVIYVEWQGTGRRYVAKVQPGRETRVEIDWDSDSNFVVSEEWIGYQLPTTLRDKLDGYVTLLVRQRLHVDPIAVLSFEQTGGHRFLTATVFIAPAGEKLDTMRIELGGDREPERVQALAAWLSVRERSPELVPVTDTHDDMAPSSRHDVGPRSRGIPTLSYVATGAAIPIAATGVYLLHLNGRGTCPAGTADDCPQVYKTAPPGWTLVGASIGVIGFAVYWYVRDRGAGTLPAVSIEAGRQSGAVLVGGRF